MSSCGRPQDPNRKYRVTVVKQAPGAEIQARGILYDSLLLQVLREGDIEGFRKFLSRTGRALPPEMMLDTVRIQTMMHQLILNAPELEDLHARSREWLDQNTVLGADTSLAEASRISAEEKMLREQGENKTPKRTINLRQVN